MSGAAWMWTTFFLVGWIHRDTLIGFVSEAVERPGNRRTQRRCTGHAGATPTVRLVGPAPFDQDSVDA